MEDNFLNKSNFTKLVEKTVIDKRVSYMDAILLICEENTIDPGDVKKFVSPIIKDKLEAEARDLNFLPRQNKIDSSFFG
jgi:hypothetical protein